MAATVRRLLHAHPEWGRRPRIVDVGGGHGQFAAPRRDLGDRVAVTLVDIVPSKLEAAAAAPPRAEPARRAAQPRFVPGDAAELAASGALEAADVRVGLHACGG